MNKLSPNISKTEYMIMGHPRKAKATNAPKGLTLSNKEIKRVFSTKSLGVMVDEYMVSTELKLKVQSNFQKR